MVKWEDKYSLGVESIDEQHKELFRIANRIYELLKNEMILDKYDHIMEIIDELKNYTVDHFKDEEEYMKSIGYKKFLSHKVAHTDFLDKMENIDVNKIDNGHNEYLLSILDFVCLWLVEHIMKEDKLIVA
ncbi:MULTISPECIES: bacteriohemerythrin [Pelosinus]|jgi:hemerythrin|uniref:Hemerythrin-like metal-binding protein n=1 Tax=Pelosinus fermentans B4 TaxID=1149862 RepID=I9LIM3_9FIRM|nr:MULTISPECIES: hemerythrin family protein [Pelosinus]EIW20344.1 hemerythrin-like metal-binding protein [Pelosinus fermentans B4]EIW25597.1 hemerythrin-like metal-binding protein [Pelosinus fermentans A11]OAM93319.1 hemerythrin-like metal-binding protein [Pelosinus fermentans DSM 17108]SDQ73789.1 hemerythrin [Pelosinus fermentans]